jgi:hypothetical protein
MLVDQREAVAWNRVADGNSRVVRAAGIIDETLHHRRFRGGIDQLDCRVRDRPQPETLSHRSGILAKKEARLP